ncbi:breast cancer type 1 susceptibility protein homolog [Neodiprion virginianus]|uniref:breast cancer type 1 susceptibility protein homolog n=1 Tax=Neodiprion virginianus TaxID=2961670 RepID=UPI001EE6C1E5|nr:breast cancer type 1 susceptibility protein homolog [Neodiprion virginianus]XP_046619452.1 breast cancer type 1 susceptibility protein homolog [Neodiprion virginianus]
MNEFEVDTEVKRIAEAIASSRETLQCTFCRQLPNEAVSGKCGHPICKNCASKICGTRKAICPICKTILTRSSIRKVKAIDDAVKCLKRLIDAFETDSRTNFLSFNLIPTKQDKDPKPSTSGIVEHHFVTNQPQRSRKSSAADGIRRRATIDSGETLKITRRNSLHRNEDLTSMSNESNTTLGKGHASMVHGLLAKSEPLEPNEKVGLWLDSEEFDEQLVVVGEIEKPVIPLVPSIATTEVPDSASIDRPNSRMSLQSSRKTTSLTKKNRASSTPKKKKNGITYNTTREENMFDELCGKKVSEQPTQNRKVKIASSSADSSWCKLEQFEQETSAKVRKRKRLNISIEKPSTSKQVVGTLDLECSEDDDKIEDAKSSENLIDSNNVQGKNKPHIISDRKLETEEILYLPKLNKRQVKEIIGVSCTQTDFDTSKNSSFSPEKSPTKLRNNQTSLRKSDNSNHNNSNDSLPLQIEPEKDTTSCIESIVRPKSRLSLSLSGSRPSSRLSHKSPSESTVRILQQRTDEKSPILGMSSVRVSFHQNDEETKEGTQRNQSNSSTGKDRSIRSCSGFMKRNLVLKRLSSESGKHNVSMLKRGKLYRSRSNVKFLRLGSIISRTLRNELKNIFCSGKVSTCDVETQTNSRLTQTNHMVCSVCKKHVSSEALDNVIIPETRTVSSVSSKSKATQIKEVGTSDPATQRALIEEEFDTVNKVNMMSPKEDSQLKYLSTESPTVDNTERSVKKRRRSPDLQEYAQAIENYANKLIVTDSEDQDTPCQEKFLSSKEINDQTQEKKISSLGTTFSTKTSLLSKITDNPNCLLNLSKSRSPSSRSDTKSLHTSPKRRIRASDSFASESKRQSMEKRKLQIKMSGSYCNTSSDSDGETIRVKKATPISMRKCSGGSKSPMANAKYKVVRKLKYSQESGSNPGTNLRTSQPLEQQGTHEKENRAEEPSTKKTFKRIRQMSSPELQDDYLETEVTSKTSGSNSSLIGARPIVSWEANKSPLPSEELSVVFSSNKETQDSKRKRSPSPSSIDIHAIASNWCADLNLSSEEFDNKNDSVLGVFSSKATKKKKLQIDNSPVSSSSDSLPILDQTAFYGKPRKGTDSISKSENHDVTDRVVNEKNTITRDCGDEVEEAIEVNKGSLNNSQSSAKDITSDKDKRNRSNCDLEDARIPSERNENSCGENAISAMSNISVEKNEIAENMDSLLQLGDKLNGVITPRGNSTPIKNKSFQNRNPVTFHRHSYNSNKENEAERESENEEDKGKEGTLLRDSSKLTNRTTHEASKVKNIRISNERNDTVESARVDGDVESCQSSFDHDCMNITQDHMMLQEVENNLLRPKSIKEREKNSRNNVQKSVDEKATKISPQKKSLVAMDNQKVKACTETHSDDSETMGEDIIERTPEKTKALKKDLYDHIENSQRSTVSRRSFMSVDITPIQRKFQKFMHTATNVSPLVERAGKSSADQHGAAKIARLSFHSTPKSVDPKKNLFARPVLTKPRGASESRLCFVCSNLTLPQIENVKAFARLHNADYTVNYKPEVTHVIVKTEEDDSAARTMKYLLGIAHKKWIVSYQWVTDSSSQNRLLEEEDYEVVDSDTHEPGPRRSRLSKTGLFDEFAFTCMAATSEIPVSNLQDLVGSSGGTVFQTLEDLATERNKYKVILYDTDTQQPTVLDKWRQKSRALPVPLEWVLTCISQYELVSLYSYLPPFTPEVAANLGFPQELLIEDEEDSLSPNETSASNAA